MIKTKCWDQNEKSTKCKDQKCIYALFILNKDLLLAGFFCTWILKKKKKICGMYLDGLWVYANFLLDSLYQNFLLGYLYNYLRGFPCLNSSFFSSKIPLHLYV